MYLFGLHRWWTTNYTGAVQSSTAPSTLYWRSLEWSWCVLLGSCGSSLGLLSRSGPVWGNIQINYWINIYCDVFNSLLSFRKAAEHPPISTALIQGCECSETGSPGRGESRRLHSPLRRCKYKPSFSFLYACSAEDMVTSSGHVSGLTMSSSGGQGQF